MDPGHFLSQHYYDCPCGSHPSLKTKVCVPFPRAYSPLHALPCNLPLLLCPSSKPWVSAPRTYLEIHWLQSGILVSASTLLNIVQLASVPTKLGGPPCCFGVSPLSRVYSRCARKTKAPGVLFNPLSCSQSQMGHPSHTLDIKSLHGVGQVRHCFSPSKIHLASVDIRDAYLCVTIFLSHQHYCSGHTTLLVCCPCLWSVHYIYQGASPCCGSASLSGHPYSRMSRQVSTTGSISQYASDCPEPIEVRVDPTSPEISAGTNSLLGVFKSGPGLSPVQGFPSTGQSSDSPLSLVGFLQVFSWI